MNKQEYKAILNIVDRCHNNSKEKGWWENAPKPEDKGYHDMIASKLMLIVSEVSEALEELRVQEDIGNMYYSGTLFGDPILGSYDYVQEYLSVNGRKAKPKPEGFPSELADVIIRVFDLCKHLDIDIAEAIDKKMDYNESRKYKHGGKAI